MTTTSLYGEILNTERITPKQALKIIEVMPSEELYELGNAVRQRNKPDNVVTYVIDRNINYSNVCASVCNFCAFFRKPGAPDAYVHSYEEIYQKVEEMLELGGSGVLMQGGLHPNLPFEYYLNMLRQLKSRYGIHLHCFSPPEIDNFAKIYNLSLEEVLIQLKEAGLDSVPGAGAEILVDEFRKKRRSKCTGEEWLQVMRVAHKLNIPTTATMMFGMGEKIEHRIDHLEKLATLQDETGGFISFIPWTLQPDNTAIGKIYPDRVPPEEYLRWFALSRIYLQKIPNSQVSWLTQGLDVGKKALHCGANDLGSIMIEENVISQAGANHKATESMLRHAIEDEGYVPIKRNAAYLRLDQ
ncbi:Aminodeoxyfutalosine synthase [Legionella nautarum]|uniref:Aminodeoxyfutalosine synthase n=1 Tax=Legionella nautarum TaxID=45070 RepID=A0A0W0WL89_9GAMM|nr:cyclic dehypoxanthinyl futalosine synthase [Legionella nautarum]KTD33071.1 Aminodeoxyfutalosine synthase [Legionella nautarum]